MSRGLKLATVLLGATLAVSACGKRGALEPPSYNDDEGHHSKKSASRSKVTKDKEGYYHAKPADQTAEHRPFVLDGLLR